jgi:hypothetical protein
MDTTLIFWRQRDGNELSPAEVARELQLGNDVEGLIDLAVQEIVAALQSAFPTAVEKAGELVWRQGGEAFEATWTWQHIACQCHALSDDSRERLLAVLERFDCPAYDTMLGIRLEQ